jgi:hypothetical protein
VEPYFHSPNTPSWRGAQFKKKSTGTTLPLPLSLPLLLLYHCGTRRERLVKAMKNPAEI